MAEVVLRIRDWPEALSAMRKALADVLREVAEDEAPATAARLRAAADRFEMGLPEDE